MLHSKIENEEIVDRYVRNQLEPADRQAFEEHFFACEECFEMLQTTERFVAGMRDAANRGLLNEPSASIAGAPGRRLGWALAAMTCATLVFAAITAWMYFVQTPNLRGDLDRTTAELQTERRLREELDRRTTPAEQA